MASAYRVQIVDHETGEVVHAWAPGLEVEVELIENLKRRVQAKGVGLTRTTQHVLEDIDAAMRELLHDLKRTVPPKRL